MEFRRVGAADVGLLVEVFGGIDRRFFRPHPFTEAQARRIAEHPGRDVYLLLLVAGRPIGYGMLRGWDEDYATPSLGIAIRTSEQRRGYGRALMGELHRVAREVGCDQVRLRVHEDNVPARRLYEGLDYEYRGVERGELVMVRTLP